MGWLGDQLARNFGGRDFEDLFEAAQRGDVNRLRVLLGKHPQWLYTRKTRRLQPMAVQLRPVSDRMLPPDMPSAEPPLSRRWSPAVRRCVWCQVRSGWRASHAWLLQDPGFIIDITADQFQDWRDGGYPPVHVGAVTAWHAGWRIESARTPTGLLFDELERGWGTQPIVDEMRRALARDQ